MPGTYRVCFFAIRQLTVAMENIEHQLGAFLGSEFTSKRQRIAIDGIERFDETHVFADCFVFSHATDESTSGDPEHIYVLEKKDKAWHVVKAARRWYD